MTLEPKRRLGYAALGVMEGHLKDREFFVADRYSIADVALYAYTHVAHEGGFELGPFHQRLAEAGRGAARARTYNLGLARTVMEEVRLARARPSRLGLGRRRAHVRQLDGQLLRVAGIRFPRVNVGTSAPEFLTRFDTTLTPLGTQYGATQGMAEQRNRLI